MDKDKGRFVKIICARCGNRQVIFGKACTRVKCIRCNKLLVQNFGGKSRIRAFVQEVCDAEGR